MGVSSYGEEHSAKAGDSSQRRRHCAFLPELKKDGWALIYGLRLHHSETMQKALGEEEGGGGLDKTFPKPVFSSGPRIKGDEGAGMAPRMKAETEPGRREDTTKSRSGPPSKAGKAPAT